MTSKRGGRKYKDAGITENFNPNKLGVTKADVAKAKRVAAAEKKLASPRPPRKKPPAPEPTPEITGYDDDGWPIFAEPEEPPPPGAAGTNGRAPITPPGTEEDDDTASAHQMLEDMRWVYKQLKGRNKLQILMANDKEFMALVKELMKAEVSILTNKMKARDGGNKQGFLVILKGLEEERPILDAIEKNKAIDVRQIERAMNPSEFQMDLEDDAADQSEKPAEIVKKADTVDSVENW